MKTEDIQQTINQLQSIPPDKKVEEIIKLVKQIDNFPPEIDFTQIIKEAIEITEKNDNLKDHSDLYCHLGKLYQQQNKYGEALECYRKAETIKIALNDIKGLGDLYTHIGILNINTEKFDYAIECLKKAMQFYQQVDENASIAHCLNNIGSVMWHQHRFEKALDYFNQAFKIWKKHDDQNSLIKAYSNLGLVYFDKKQVEKSREYHLKALELEEKLGADYPKAITLNNLAIIDEFEDKYQQSLDKMLCSEEIALNQKELHFLAHLQLNIARLYLKTDQLENARSYLDKCYEPIQKLDSEKMLEYYYKYLSDYYYKTKDSNLAYEYLSKSLEISKKVWQSESLKKIMKVQMEMEITKRKKLIDEKNCINKFLINQFDKPSILFDLNSEQILEINKIFEKMIGYSENEIYEMNFSQLITENSMASVREIPRHIQTGEIVEPDVEFITESKSRTVSKCKAELLSMGPKKFILLILKTNDGIN
ncbi:MAG: tetratricopeptide repeat protein [bacterium]